MTNFTSYSIKYDFIITDCHRIKQSIGPCHFKLSGIWDLQDVVRVKSVVTVTSLEGLKEV